MFTVTESAVMAVTEYFRNSTVQPIRVFLTQGCGGQQLSMALDAAKSSDSIHPAGAYQFVIDQKLMEQVQPITIDYIDMGFKIDSALPKGDGCASCGTTGSCCGSEH